VSAMSWSACWAGVRAGAARGDDVLDAEVPAEGGFADDIGSVGVADGGDVVGAVGVRRFVAAAIGGHGECGQGRHRCEPELPGNTGHQPIRSFIVTACSPRCRSPSRIGPIAARVSRWPKCRLTIEPGRTRRSVVSTTAEEPGSV
jgi:hypothetical protein